MKRPGLSFTVSTSVLLALVVTISGWGLSVTPQRPDIQSLLDQVPEGASWQALSTELRDAFAANAAATLKRDRQRWGLSGLSQKLARLAAPTDAMRDNVNRVLSSEFAPELPEGFVIDRDVTDARLRNVLLRVYLLITSERSHLLHDHRDFKGWDGLPIREFRYVDHEHERALRMWSEDTMQMIRWIDEATLSPTEQAVLGKSRHRLRTHRFDAPHVADVGDPMLSSLYKLDPTLRPFATDIALLDAYNASMFSDVRSVDRGTLQSFLFNFDAEFSETWLRDQGMPARLVSSILKLGHLFKTRVLAHDDRDKQCTIYSPADRAKVWDEFTARMIANQDGTETMDGYEATHRAIAERRAMQITALAGDTLDQLFPASARTLTAERRADIKRALRAETRPAAILGTLQTELGRGTSPATALRTLERAIEQQIAIGGYAPGEPLRRADERDVLDMWQTIRAYIQREYRGYEVDLAALVPERPTITTTDDSTFALAGDVSISLKERTNVVSLYATLLHEIKHAIDQRSGAAVEGAAIEGAAVAVEDLVWPRFVEGAMAGRGVNMPLARLITEIDFVRFAATTDATLQLFSRPSCDAGQPDTVDFAKSIVAGYGYTDDDTLTLRSIRAHNNTQYLEYQYGVTVYLDLLEYLQAASTTVRVDPFVLHACGMPNPKKNQQSLDRLKACLSARRQ